MAHRITPQYVAKNLAVVIGLVLIWRGVWYLLDAIDLTYFNGGHTLTATAGIILGLIVLYIPDHDLKEMGKL